jgi:3-oxoacyl-(acyl-carrier-protein) synthase
MAQVITRPVYAIATNITSAMGLDTAAHWQRTAAGKVAVMGYEDMSFSKTPFWASKLDAMQWQAVAAQANTGSPVSPFEQMAFYSAKQALQNCADELNPQQTVLILATTKGNIEWLGEVPDNRLLLHTSASIISKQLGLHPKPIVISHACVSGVVALTHALRLLQQGVYRNAIVVGCDRFSKFVLSGFQSFQAIADEACKPFDANRKGINLGEAASTIILSSQEQPYEPLAKLSAGATSNDANHISGPSRTGEELAQAISRAMNEAGLVSSDIGMVSAHGTATPYNDEMESKAFNLAGLNATPVHSFKGYIGHTLGAAGVLESAMCIEALRYQQTIPSAGYELHGVPVPLNVTRRMEHAKIAHVLKTASGFGGCNATAIWSKI